MRKGFSLIELLVVIAIIGILSSMISFAFSESQQKSRDSRRKSDMEAIRKALDLAKQDSAGSYSYPNCDTYTSGSCTLGNTNTNPDLTPSSGTPYIKAVPTDPKTSSGYTYTPSPASCGPAACTSFVIVACLENKKDSQRDEIQSGGSNNSTICSDTNTRSLTISNL